MSDDGAKEAAAGSHATATVRVALKDMWDASLTFDLLDDPSDKAEDDHGPIFVGREELLGALVNAIGQPDRRGTYLVSGYRGAGKTSLIIQATRRARSRLIESDWQLLPVVLNVSEVSASLDPLSTVDSNSLEIDARRLLTALLRALRNRVPVTRKSASSNALAQKIQWAYQKAEATRYSETQQQRAESVHTTVRETKRSFDIPDVFKLVAAVAVLGAAAVEGIALFGSIFNQLHVIAIALVGVAAFSFQRSVTLTRKSTQAASASSELVRDNSVHQLESELKDILESLYKERQRTVIILEELDKIDDAEGRQLDSVIRYFKNLFTQAPALFFFLTDKAYYDIIAKKIELARRQRSYAIEHTFFTHRLFVSRPRIEECLKYLMAAFSRSIDSSQIEVIEEVQGNRVRGLEEMSPLEQVIRTFLFRSQDHFFDLKNEMRQFVRVGPTESWLESDEGMMPKSERALAALQFLVEQKMLTYRFRGGNDYANEELRNCLFAVFEALGSSEPQQIARFHPSLDPEGDPLTLSERRRIIEAVDSLIEDLERGGAITRLPSDPGTVEKGQVEERFLWKDQAAVSFKPVARVEPHEQALFDDLSRFARWVESFGQGGFQRKFDDAAVEPKTLSKQISQRVQAMKRSPIAIPIEDVPSRRREAEKEIAPFLERALTAHQQRLIGIYGLDLRPISRAAPLNAFVLLPDDSPTRPPVFLVYESSSQADRVRLPDELEQFAVVSVVLDDLPERSGQLPMRVWDASLIPEEAGEHDFVNVPLQENLGAEAFDDQWGERTADELRLAQVWSQRVIQRKANTPSTSELAGPYTLLTSGQLRMERLSLDRAFSAWFETDDAVLVRPPQAGPSWDAIEQQLTANQVNQPRVLVPYDSQFTDTSGRKISEQEKASFDRLIAAGRVVFRVSNPFELSAAPVPFRQRVMLETRDTDGLPERLGVSVMHLQDSEVDFMTVVQLVQGRYPDYAALVLQAPAEAGNADAMARLALLLADRNPEEAREWRARLAESENASEIRMAALVLEDGHPNDAAELYRPLAEAGNAEAMMRLAVLLAERYPKEARQWQARLAESGNADRIRAAANRLAVGHPDDAAELYRPLAEAGDAGAMTGLAVLLADRNPEEARQWQARLAQSGNASEIRGAARGLEDGYPDDAAELYRPLAEAGDAGAMARLAVLLADRNPEEARQWQARLAQSGNASEIRGAAGRLEDGHPDDAAELYRPLAEAGDAGAMVRLALLLADRNPEEARQWLARLAQSGNASEIRGAARRLEDGYPDGAAELYRPLAEAEDIEAMAGLALLLADRNPEEARQWLARLAQSGNASEIRAAAWRLEDGYPDGAAELFRPLAEAEDIEAMAGLAVLLADRNPEEARQRRARLAQSGNADLIRAVAGRLEDGNPDDAAELYRPLAEAGNADAMVRLARLLADRNPDEARQWQARLDEGPSSRRR